MDRTLHSASLPKSSLSLVPTTGRTQTAYCIGPAIRCMIDLTGLHSQKMRHKRNRSQARLSELCDYISM